MHRIKQLYRQHLRHICAFFVRISFIFELVLDTGPIHLLRLLEPITYFNTRLLTSLPYDEYPTPQRTKFVVLYAIIGMTAVITSVLANLARNPEMLYTIPIYGFFVIIIMLLRQHKINMLAA